MSNEYFYARGEEQFGPVSGGQLKALATSGELEPTDLVWKEGMPDWVEARRIKGVVSPRRSDSSTHKTDANTTGRRHSPGSARCGCRPI